MKKKIEPYLYMLPGLIILTMFVFYPIVRNIGYSLLSWDLFKGTKKFIGFHNYGKLVQNEVFLVALKNNIYYIIISLIFQVGLSLVLAGILENIKNKRLSVVFRTTFFIPSLISLTVIGLLFTFIYQPTGLLNAILDAAHLSGLKHGWIGEEGTAIFAVIAVSQWKSIGYTMMLLIVAIQRIPEELNEAAVLDGAGTIKRFLHITVPNIKDTILMTFIITTSGGFLIFNEVYIITGGGPSNASEVMSTMMYNYAFVHGKIGYSSAIGTIILILSMLIAGIQSGIFTMHKED
jgi:raffinose/stachyose/melibiose transport system permease protein